MEPHRIPGPNDIFSGFGTVHSDSSSFNNVSYANSYGLGLDPANEYGSCHSTASEIYYSSPFIQDHAMLQTDGMPAPVAPRVHINPNYRPKVLGHQSMIPNRPANVHINPHWKGRVESASQIEDNAQGEGSNAQTVGKKTIFVNPKVLSQLNLKQPPRPVETRQTSGLHFNNLPSENEISRLSSRPSGTTISPNTSSETKKMREEISKKPGVVKSVTERSFVVLNSRKLVRKTNSTHYHKLLSSEVNKRSPTGCSSTQKLARQVASKYKLVRSPTTAQNVLKTVNSVPTTYFRKSGRKSVNPRHSSVSNSKSVYKFIRQPEDCGSFTEQVKVGKKLDQSFVCHTPRIQLENSRLRRSLKSRYRLIKAQPSHHKEPAASQEKARTDHSRYKLVRHGSAESKSSFRNSSMSNFSLYSSPIRSKNRSLNANKPSYGRKVSRFRIVQASTAKSRTQVLMSGSGSHCRSNCVKSNFLKSGLYKNISWQKERYQAVGRSIKNSSQKNEMSTLSSKSVPNRSLVNIGGVLYRSTRTTLTRTSTGTRERILHIRGRRFVMDGKGKTIRPSSTEDSSGASSSGKLLARVDIGGVTFTRRSDNTLVRTNTHYARNLLSLAKMRSIALLTDKLRKNNQPCLIYHRFGKCLAHLAGKCWRVHDPRNISICRKFLQGTCESEKCLLSHDVGPEKMPTCRYFLEGCCVRDNCPYLHVKLSANADICRQFLHGYCDAGDMCKKRHLFLCPEFEKDGKCSKGRYCPYPHVSCAKRKPRKKRSTVFKHPKDTVKLKENWKQVNELDKSASLKETEKVKRYYEGSSSCELLNKSQLDHMDSDSETSCDSDKGTNGEKGNVQRTSKIGILPAYIPL
ncbi:zinc finger CCCH domain-containing protein 3 isoform X2 [Thrips palmi]|uniref:Zinc finger CCCH domain-containing protein 3 n=1 Tax=Thrips palmi TaxID=161013 RepID=A0A6P9A871_THRPL|nr:zinc finger CCCH domain-containing protein 3 isoform X2 [Thrips palmi]